MTNDCFDGKVAVVTGAGGTLCSELAASLAAKGAKVVLVGRTRDKLERVAARIREGGGVCKTAACDVTDETGMRAIADETLAEWGPCRFLLNGAGGNNNKAITTNFTFQREELSADKPKDMVGFFDLDLDVIGSVLKINIIGTVIPSRIFGRQMSEHGGGAIVNFASMNSYRPLTRVPAYAMSKAAIVNFTEWLAVYFAPAGIRVNAVAPGFFINERSKLILGTPGEGLTQRGQNVMNHTPAGRFGDPGDLVGCVEWLLDDRAAAYVTGTTIPVDGGFQAHSGI